MFPANLWRMVNLGQSEKVVNVSSLATSARPGTVIDRVRPEVDPAVVVASTTTTARSHDGRRYFSIL